jgi:hypothetical protein
MLSKFSRYEELNPPGLGQAQILIHSDLTKQYEVKVDVSGVSKAIVESGLDNDTTVRLCVVEGIHIPGTDTIYGRPEYLNRRNENDRHFFSPEDSKQETYLSIMSNLIRNAVRLSDARNNRRQVLVEQAAYRPAIFLGSVVLSALQGGLGDLETGKFVGKDRKHEIEHDIFMRHRNDIQIVEK